MQVALQPRRLAAHQLAGIGVFLLRHQRRTGAKRIRQLDKLELGAAPENQVFRDA
jgi:hypothetical protein